MTASGKFPRLHELFESRRAYPRLRLEIPVTLQRSDGIEVNARFNDLSPDGAQLRYDADTAVRLFGEKMEVSALRTLKYRLRTRLQAGEFSADIDIGFSPVYQRHLEDGTYAMGILFDVGDKPMLGHINAFLLYELQPEENPGSAPAARPTAPPPTAAVIPQSTIAPAPPATADATTSDTDQLRTALRQITAELHSLHETVNDIRQRLMELDRKL